MNTTSINRLGSFVKVIFWISVLIYIIAISATIYGVSALGINVIGQDIQNEIPIQLFYLKLAISIGYSSALLYVLYLIKTMIQQVKNSGPFVSDNLYYLKTITNYIWICLSLFIADHIVSFIIKAVKEGETSFTLNFGFDQVLPILLILILYVMIDIFKYGIKIYQEQQLTI